MVTDTYVALTTLSLPLRKCYREDKSQNFHGRGRHRPNNFKLAALINAEEKSLLHLEYIEDKTSDLLLLEFLEQKVCHHCHCHHHHL